jgi:hypothetical protein
MERKLEPKDIAGHLPYKMFCDTKLDSGMYCNEILGTMNNDVFIVYRNTHIVRLFQQIKPILRPISDLYRIITHNGKDIIPILELAKMIYSCEWELYQLDDFLFAKCGLLVFFYSEYEKSFRLQKDDCDEFIINQYQLFDYMNELKIDYRGLIEAGLAIDVNTLENNVYK